MADRPNIVYILADDLGYGDVSCLNPDSKIQTPNMDRVAAEGLTFTDAHSGSAVCTPTRYGIMTGRYCWRSRLKKGVLFGYSEPLIEQGRTTVASLLHHYGYTTACIGKWHLGLGWHKRAEGQEDVDFSVPLTSGPHTLGFDHSYIIPASLDMAPYCYIEDGRVVELPTAQCQDSPRPAYYRGGACAPGFQHETTLLELTMRAEGFINRHVRERPDDPFFLYFQTSSPHTPHVARAPFRGQSQAGPYGDFVVEHDWSIGRILNTLDRHGLSDTTLVYVTSDNGCHSGPPRLWEDYQHRANYHFRGQKSDAWDGGHRIPLLVRWPGQVKAGAVCEQTVCLTDLLHTSAAMCDHQLAGTRARTATTSCLTCAATPRGRSARRRSTTASTATSRSGRGRGSWCSAEVQAAGRCRRRMSRPRRRRCSSTTWPTCRGAAQRAGRASRGGRAADGVGAQVPGRAAERAGGVNWAPYHSRGRLSRYLQR